MQIHPIRFKAILIVLLTTIGGSLFSFVLNTGSYGYNNPVEAILIGGAIGWICGLLLAIIYSNWSLHEGIKK